MAFSQKHSGKVFVPWFNTTEWRCVYKFLTSNLQEDLNKALDILTVWKIRTPLLSAGIEGTLILLEAKLIDKDNISESHLQQIYSISLMRFLNICAANSDKQGTFNRIVSKNDLPKWLIDIRHDIAHSNRLPSKSILEIAIGCSFQWLFEKYWTVQNETICDYFIDADNMNATIVDTLNAHVRLSVGLYKGVDMTEYDKALMEKINYLISKRYNKTKTDAQGLLIILEEMLKQALSDPCNKNMAYKITEILVHKQALLNVRLETNEEGVETIPRNFKDIWLNLLNVLLENEFLDALLHNLLDAAINVKDEEIQKIAFIWICDILNGLLKIESIQRELQSKENQLDSAANIILVKSKLENDNPEFQDCIEFEPETRLNSIQLMNFEKTIVDEPNSLSIKFLDKVMMLNNNSIEHRNVVVNMAKTMCDVNCQIPMCISSIATITDIPMDLDILEASIPLANISSAVEEVDMQEQIVQNGRRWNRIKDISVYKECPLGILPSQERTENPLLHINV